MPPPDPASPLRRATLLLVEDEVVLKEVAKEALELEGYHVLAFDHPRRALETAARWEGPIDLLVTDLVMPGMNGMELHVHLRVLRPQLPILLMSGYTADVVARHGGLAPGIPFLQKPFSLRDLCSRVRGLLPTPEPIGTVD